MEIFEILQVLGSESWKLVLESNNSDDYHILRELDDHGILVKFQRNFDQNSFQELDDLVIPIKLFKDFDQNFGSQKIR